MVLQSPSKDQEKGMDILLDQAEARGYSWLHTLGR